MRPFSLASCLALALPFLVVADSHGDAAHKRHHHEVAKRAPADIQLHKRFENTRFTFFATGLGACGVFNHPGDFIVALNTPQYGSGSPGPQCFKAITINYGGKSAQATIMDECPGCPFGGLDMTTGLFDYFADPSVGVLYGSWTFNGGDGDPHGGGPGGGYNPPATHAHTTHNDPPTTTPDPPTTTKTHTRTHTTSHTSSRSKSSSSSSSTTSSSSTATSSTIDLESIRNAGIAIPTGTVPASGSGNPQNIYGLDTVLINIADLIVIGSDL
jgi:hypothetical protein